MMTNVEIDNLRVELQRILASECRVVISLDCVLAYFDNYVYYLSPTNGGIFYEHCLPNVQYNVIILFTDFKIIDKVYSNGYFEERIKILYSNVIDHKGKYKAYPEEKRISILYLTSGNEIINDTLSIDIYERDYKTDYTENNFKLINEL